jgi:hypothetical protein
MAGWGNVGAYGFRLVPSDPELRLPDLVQQAESAPPVRLDWRRGSGCVDRETVDDGAFLMVHRRGGYLSVMRDPPTIVAALPLPSSAAAIVHPLATMPLSFIAHWHGCATLHGGAFMHAGRAWVLCGEQEAGKSSMLAELARRGVPIVADDLVVIDGAEVCAGPRCVDLRPDAAAHFPAACSLGVVSGRERFRLPTPPAPARVPLGGLCVLAWSEGDDRDASVEALAVEECIALLYAQHYAGRIGPPNPHLAMELLGRPMWRFTRSRSWSDGGRALDQLLAVLSAT